MSARARYAGVGTGLQGSNTDGVDPDSTWNMSRACFNIAVLEMLPESLHQYVGQQGLYRE